MDFEAWTETLDPLEFLSDVLDGSAAWALIGLDAIGTINQWSPGAQRLYGFEAGQVTGRESLAVLYPDDPEGPERASDVLEAARRHGKWDGNAIHVRRDGERVAVRLVAGPRRGPSGEFIGFVLISREVAENEAVPATDCQISTRFLIASDINALMSVDAQSIITDVSPTMQSLLGRPRGELAGRPFPALFTEVELARQKLQRVLQGERLDNLPLTVTGRSGDAVVQCSAVAIHDTRGHVREVLVAARTASASREQQESRGQTAPAESDPTETAPAESGQASASTAGSSDFLARMRHELLSPLNAIMGFTGMLLMKLPGPLTAEQEKQLTLIQSSARQMQSLVNQLRDLLKIRCGEFTLQQETFPCRGLLNEVVALLKPLAAERGVQLVVECDDDSALRSDRPVMLQILWNLTDNAVRFTESGGRVMLKVRQVREGNRTVSYFSVVDTGIGISEDDQETLFQAFRQVGDPESRNEEGAGLGLYASRKLAELLGGRIEFHSSEVEGSTFTLVVPG